MNNEERGLTLTDKNKLEIILELEKNLSNNYSIAMNEASNNDLYESYFDMFTSVKDMTRDIFDLMSYLGWYNLEYVDENKIDKKIETLTKQLDSLEQ